MSRRRSSKRMSTLNQEQIAYINGCATLQRAIWRLTHKDPLSAMTNQIEERTFRRAIQLLIALREKCRETGLKSAIEKWHKTIKIIRLMLIYLYVCLLGTNKHLSKYSLPFLSIFFLLLSIDNIGFLLGK